MIREYLEGLRAAGAAMRAGGIAMRKGFTLKLPDLNYTETESTPTLRGFERDAANLAGDWQMVGRGIQDAMQKTGRKSGQKKAS